MDVNKRIQILEQKLITPENFSVKEYLNFGTYSVLSENSRLLILKDFEKLSTAEQQRRLSILFAIQPYRTKIGIPMFITCGYRSYAHELRKFRKGGSRHLLDAIDFTCLETQGLNKYASVLNSNWYGGFKHYANKRFIHADKGEKRTW